ncbi:MAG: hypothetical protein K9G61_04465 [Bacteroidales bacterium]|jgi:hypothetical protein|nr:hypothetical protein [Bacteroidota bacterium]MCF8348045.1 hypothetical protein [Bacteroidales bacterium]
MREIVILIPDIDTEQNVEIDVRINGKTKTRQYRVELLSWEGSPDSERVTVIQHRLNAYDKNWALVEIGAPEGKKIPLLFRRVNPPETE